VSRWDDLERETDRWAALGRMAEFWWRDDDATTASPELRRLIDRQRPIALAVIPGRLQESLLTIVEASDWISVLQHGIEHRNWAPESEKKSEFPDRRAPTEALPALSQAREKLIAAFGARFVAALVPPWNRISAPIADGLSDAGFLGLSTYRPRPGEWASQGIRQVNTHVDVVDWRGGRGFLGDDAAIGLIVDHLSAKRTGKCDWLEPTGLLTHHLVHDTETWRFLDEFDAWSGRRREIVWRAAPELFSIAASA
jgi:hypothetical protein